MDGRVQGSQTIRLEGSEKLRIHLSECPTGFPQRRAVPEFILPCTTTNVPSSTKVASKPKNQLSATMHFRLQGIHSKESRWSTSHATQLGPFSSHRQAVGPISVCFPVMLEMIGHPEVGLQRKGGLHRWFQSRQTRDGLLLKHGDFLDYENNGSQVMVKAPKGTLQISWTLV